MENFHREIEATRKLEFIIEDFTQYLGQAALEVLKDHCGDPIDLDHLDQPEQLAPEDFTEERAIDLDVEFSDWKFMIKEILDLTNQRVVQTVDDIEVFESGTF